MMDLNAQEALDAGLKLLPFSVSDEQKALLIQYLELLNHWNSQINLTGIRDPREQVIRHLLDCLAIIPHLPNGDLADIGSGAGLPALMIAIIQPERTVYAVESIGKKARFIQTASEALGLKNVVVVNDRAEKWQKKCAVIVSRAMAEVNLFLKLTAHLGDKKSAWILMKGQQTESVKDKRFSAEIIQLSVPLLDAERHLMLLKSA